MQSHDAEFREAGEVKPRYCEACGHHITRQKPLPEMDAEPDGLVGRCRKGCFCTYGGCMPEKRDED